MVNTIDLILVDKEMKVIGHEAVSEESDVPSIVFDW